jgi:PKD repeat protein
VVTIVAEPISGLMAANDSPTIIGNATTLGATVAAGSLVNYTWAFGDGDMGSGAVIAHTYPDVGIYTAVVTASNPINSVSTTTVVTITDAPITGLSAANNSPTNIGSSTNLMASVTSGTNINYTWDFGDGTTGSGANTSHTYPDIGMYTAVVTASNSVSTLTATTDVNIIDIAITGLTADNDGPTTLGDVTNLIASVANGTNVNYTWAFGDGTMGSGANPSHIYPDVGVYTAVVTASTSTNSVTASTVVTIEDDAWTVYLPVVVKPATSANRPSHQPDTQNLTTYAQNHVAAFPQRRESILAI